MEIKEVFFISNYEVYEIIKENKNIMKEKKEKKKKNSLYFPRYSINIFKKREQLIIEESILSYFKVFAKGELIEDRESYINLIKILKKYKLSKKEEIQIFNFKPKNLLQIQLVVEDYEERFSSLEIEDMLNDIKIILK
jgi:hypothetical protein